MEKYAEKPASPATVVKSTGFARSSMRRKEAITMRSY